MKYKVINFYIIFSALIAFSNIQAQEQNSEIALNYTIEHNILYRGETSSNQDKYIDERCRLDLYYPSNKSNYATVVWFHGGGLKSGNRYIPEQLKNQSIAVAAVSYRLYPKIKCPIYIEDAAAAIAWIFKNIEKYNGNPNHLIISGHSAGGYLTSMIGLDKSWLAKHSIDANKIAGLVPFSGNAITHFIIRKERGIPGWKPIIDELAPLFHIRPDAPPLVLITGDRKLEMLGRYEENAYLMRMMKVIGHENTALYEIQGFDHGGMVEPAFTILLKHVDKILNTLKKKE